MNTEPAPPPGKILPWLALFVIAGMPMVAFLWETLHQVLALHVEPLRLLLSVPVLALFIGLLWLLGRKLGG